MDKKKIYLELQGRIGNQLFQYAFARKIQREMGEQTEIVIGDKDILLRGWTNSLQYYNLPNVSYVHENLIQTSDLKEQKLYRKIYRILTRNKDYIKKYKVEKFCQGLLNKHGVFICENGYMDANLNYNKNIYLEGYFQSEKYFEDCKYDILDLFNGKQFEQLENYNGIDSIRKRNSVCISVKIEHNVGSAMYDVCSIEYWKNAIKYIERVVENPLFFICSDNVQYVLDNLIDASKYDYIVQDVNMPVHVSLAAMAECKHFIIGNTTFGWWAQYMSNNADKIVVAPSKWMAIDMPIDIYQDNWSLIEV